jgi:tRNA uridine 5-carboxymethylaminomethyl modification enzyme
MMAALGAQATASELKRQGIDIRQDGSRRSLFEWARFPEVGEDALLNLAPELAEVDPGLRAEIWEDAHYAPYLERQASELAELRRNEAIRVPADLDYGSIGGLSNEMQEKLNAARPETLAAASRVAGITPAALAAILVHLRRKAAA